MPSGLSRTAHAVWSGAILRLADHACDLSVFLAGEAQRSRFIAEGKQPAGERRRWLWRTFGLVALVVAANLLLALVLFIRGPRGLALVPVAGALIAIAAEAHFWLKSRRG